MIATQTAAPRCENSEGTVVKGEGSDSGLHCINFLQCLAGVVHPIQESSHQSPLLGQEIEGGQGVNLFASNTSQFRGTPCVHRGGEGKRALCESHTVLDTSMETPCRWKCGTIHSGRGLRGSQHPQHTERGSTTQHRGVISVSSAGSVPASAQDIAPGMVSCPDEQQFRSREEHGDELQGLHCQILDTTRPSKVAQHRGQQQDGRCNLPPLQSSVSFSRTHAEAHTHTYIYIYTIMHGHRNKREGERPWTAH